MSHIEFIVFKDSFVVLINYNLDVFSFPILWTDVDVLLLPVYMQISFDLFVVLGSQYEIIHMFHGEGDCLGVIGVLQSNWLPFFYFFSLDFYLCFYDIFLIYIDLFFG